jgi:hypothetical protein
MGHCVPLDQKGLRQIRSWAKIEGYGLVQYRIVGAVMRRDEAVIRAPHYLWVFVPGAESENLHCPRFTLTGLMKDALVNVEACKGSHYLEGWGLLRYTHQGIELIPDTGALADDHPHAGWVPVSIPSHTASKQNWTTQPRATDAVVDLRGSKHRATPDFRVSSRLLLKLMAGFLWLSLVGGFRVGLMGDGVEPAYTAGWAQAYWPTFLKAPSESLANWAALRSFYVPVVLSPAVSAHNQADPSILQGSPLEVGEDSSAREAMPLRLVVLGLYSSREGAKHWQAAYRARGYEALVYRRRAPGKGILFAVALPYRGLEPGQFLKQVRAQLMMDAWLLEEIQSLIPDQELTAQGLLL